MKTTTVKFKFKKLRNLKVIGNKAAIKGASKVVFDFIDMIGPESAASKITIDWGDGTPVLERSKLVVYDYRVDSIFDEIKYGALGGTVLRAYEHLYHNDGAYYGKDFFAKILITWEDGSFTYIVQPITVFWDSFYDDVQELSVLNTQVLPYSTNDTFINFESKYDKATLIGAAKSSGIPLLSAIKVSRLEDLDPIGVGDEGILASSDREDILFPFSDGEKVLSIVVGYETYDTCRIIIPYYTITPNKEIIVEGEEVEFTIITDNVPDGTRVYFETSRTDLTNSRGSVVIKNNTASFVTAALIDNVPEGYTLFNATIRTGSEQGEIVAVSVDVGINDYVSPVNPPSLDPDIGLITFDNIQISTFNNVAIFPQ